jgi:hypothetical protein
MRLPRLAGPMRCNAAQDYTGWDSTPITQAVQPRNFVDRAALRNVRADSNSFRSLYRSPP